MSKTIQWTFKLWCWVSLVSLTHCKLLFNSTPNDVVAPGHFSLTLTYSDPAHFTYDNNAIAVADGKASIRELDLKIDSAAEFNAGTKNGVVVSGSKLTLGGGSTCDGSFSNCAELAESWAPRWSNLVAYWNLNETSLTPDTVDQVIDAKGTYHLTPRGESTQASPKLGARAVDLDGSGDFLDRTSNLGISNYPYTLSGWINNYDGNDIVLVSLGDNSSTLHFSSIGVNMSGEAELRIHRNGTTTALVSDVNVSGDWHHIVGVFYSASERNLYVDGNIIDTDNFMVPFQAHNSVTIGAASTSTKTLDARAHIDDVAIWNTALTLDEVRMIYNRQMAKYAGEFLSPVINAGVAKPWLNLSWKSSLPFFKELPGESGNELLSDYSDLVNDLGVNGDSSLQDDLVGLWHFNDLTDSSGFNRDLTANGSPGIGIESGKLLSHAWHQGGYYSAPLPTSNTTDLTVSTWVYSDQAEDYQPTTFFYLGNPASNGFGLVKSDGACGAGGQLAVQIGGGTCNALTGGPTYLATRTWYHLVLKRSGSTWTVYVNGVSVGNTGTANATAPTGGIYFGNVPSSGQQFYGYQDETAIWERALHDAEIFELYRRVANRTKFQVRTCASADCSDQDALTGDGWVGPGGNGNSHFSELQNNDNVIFDGSCSPFLNCLDYLINGSGLVGTKSPFSLFANFLAPPASSTYFQWRAFLESDDAGGSCSGNPCLPDLQNVSLLHRTGDVATGDEIPFYHTTAASIVNATAIPFSSLSSMTITELGSCTHTYQISTDDGASYLYFTGGTWTASSNETTHTNSKSEVEANVTSLPSGTGQLKLKAILKSNAGEECSIDAVTLDGTE